MARMQPYEDLGDQCYSAEKTSKFKGPGAEMILASLGTDRRFCLLGSLGEEGTKPSRQTPQVSQNDVSYLVA